MIKNIIKQHSIQKYILLFCACTLMLTTPLSVAMNLTNEQHNLINTIQKAYFYTKKTFSKNNIPEIKRGIKYFVEESNDKKIVLHDAVPILNIPPDIAHMNINYFYLIEIIKNNNEYSEPIIKSLKALHEYYEALCTKKNIDDHTNMIRDIIKDNSFKFTFTWPFKENSPEDSFFVSLLKQQKETIISPDSICIFVFIAPFLVSLMLTLAGMEKLYMIPIFLVVFYEYLREFSFNDLSKKRSEINSIIDASQFKSKESFKEISFLKNYFGHLYYKATKFVEKNKDQSFIKKFYLEQNKKLCIEKLIKEEDDFLFSEKAE